MPSNQRRGSGPRADAARTESRRLVAVWLATFATLAWVPGGFSRFVFAKLLVLAIAGVLAATVPRQGRLPRPVLILLGVGAAVVVIASVVGETPLASLVGRWPRYEGLPVLVLYAGSAWLGARIVGRGVPRAIQLAHAMSAMAVVLFAFSALDAAGSSPLGDSTLTRTGALLGNATDQGVVAMMAGVVVASALLDRRDWLLGCGLAASVATVALSASRIAMALTVLTLVVLALVRRRDSLRSSLLPALAVVGGLVVAVVAIPATRDRLLKTGTGEGRLLQWELTLDLVRDNLLIGLGPSRYVDAFGVHETAEWVDFTGPHQIADSPHNILLQTAVAGGLPLLLCLLALVVVVARRGFQVVGANPEAWGLLVAVAAYAVSLLANFTAAGPTLLAAFLVGALVAEQASDEEPPWHRAVAVTAFSVLGLAMLMGSIAEIRLSDGVAATGRGEVQVAVDGFDAAQAWRPRDGDVAMIGGQSLAALASAGDRESGQKAAKHAERFARDSLRRTPDSYGSLVALGAALIAQDELEEADESLTSAVALFPERPDAYIQRAVARYGLGDAPGAVADLERALEIDPKSRIAARLQRQMGSIDLTSPQ